LTSDPKIKIVFLGSAPIELLIANSLGYSSCLDSKGKGKTNGKHGLRLHQNVSTMYGARFKIPALWVMRNKLGAGQEP
jgi:hypothetical protein